MAQDCGTHIRRAGLSDMGVMLEIQRQSYGVVKWGVFAILLERLYLGKEYLIYDGERPVGFLHMRRHLNPKHHTFINLCVIPEYQGRGIGRYAMSHIIELYESKGAAVFLLKVRVDNTGAIKLYESVGFVTTGTVRRYYRDGGARIDALNMMRVGDGTL